MLSLLSTLEEGSEDDEDDDMISRFHKSLLIFPAMESFQARKLAAMLGKVSITLFQHKQALKLAVMVGDILSTHVHIFSDFLMRNEELGGPSSTPRNFVLLELKRCLMFGKALVQVAAEAFHKQEDKFLEEYILMDYFWKRNGAYLPFKSYKTFKVCFDISLVDSRLFKAFVLLSKDGDAYGVGFTLCCSSFERSQVPPRNGFHEEERWIPPGCFSDFSGNVLKHDEHFWRRDRAPVLFTLCKSFKVCFVLLLSCHSRVFSLHLACDAFIDLQIFWNNLLVHSCSFNVFIFECWLFDVPLVLSGVPGSESIKHTAHAQEANPFARYKIWFKHFLECCVHPPWSVMNDDGRGSSFPLLLVHVGRGTTRMKLVGHVNYPEVLACKTNGPLVRVECAVFGNQGTLHVPQCTADVDLAMKSDFCPFHLLVNDLLMGNTLGIKNPVDNNAQVLWTEKQEKGAFSFPLFRLSEVFKEGRLHVNPYFSISSLDEARNGPSLDMLNVSVTCQPFPWIGCPALCPLNSCKVLAWTWICMACSMQGYGNINTQGCAHVRLKISHVLHVHEEDLCILYLHVIYFVKGLCSLVMIIPNPQPNVAPLIYFFMYFVFYFNGN